MKKFSINRIYIAFLLFGIACGFCIANRNEYQNIIILALAAVLWMLLVLFAFNNPTKSEKRTINKTLSFFLDKK